MEIPIFASLPLPHLKLSFLINVPVLIAILVLFACLYTVVSSVIVYHWHAYGMKSQGIVVAESLYFFVTIVLFVCAGVSLFYF